MGKMTEDTFSVLYEYGKKVYSGELSPDDAAQKANESNPEVAVSSARHYITWYSKMRKGEYHTWNTNIKLLEYYVRKIIEELGSSEGKTAISSAKKYARHAHRDDLDQIMDKIADEQGITIESFFPDLKQAKHKTGVFDSWEIIDDETAIKHCDKSFFDYNGSGVPKGICWFFDAEDLALGENRKIELLYEGYEYTGRVTNESSDRRRTRIFWNKDLGTVLGKYSSDKNILAMFTRTSEGKYKLEMQTDKKAGRKEDSKIDIKEALEDIKKYIFARGFDYPKGLIENFYLSLKSKPFVILAGTSGTGKTKLVKLFAEAIRARCFLVSVRPDWSDGSDLFGHTNLNGEFIRGPVCDAFDYAYENSQKPVFLCLDEMNLARVEYYLSDFLSVIESRERDDHGKIITDRIAQYENGIPDNLYVVGTVNMDETTFPFSKKVLDRANTIEFSFVNLMSPHRTGESFEPADLPNEFLSTKYLVMAIDCTAEMEQVDKICQDLQNLNTILLLANAHVGYRVRDEIVFYMLNNISSGKLLDDDPAFDNEIMQKILPRIQGSSAAIKDMLIELYKYCRGNLSGIDKESNNLGVQMCALAESARYPSSAAKIGYMMKRFEEDGFTSFWL